MRLADYVTLVAVALLIIGFVFFRRTLSDALVEALSNFRGGPRPPTHPLPSNDARLLLRRAKKSRVWHL